jgi:hypothetical protein
MLHQEQVKLLFGPYRMPKCKVGGTLRCHIRGMVKVLGITAAPMQWPFTRRPGGRGGRPMLVICGDLVRAIRRESEAAIVYHWGSSIPTVWRWRKALGVGQFTEGTRDLYRRWLPEKLDEEALENQAKARQTPEFRAKLSEALRGKPMPEHVKRKLLKANKGRKPSAESRRKMSEAQKRRGSTAEPPWTPQEERLLGTMTDNEVAKTIGRTRTAVNSRRRKLAIPLFALRRPACKSPTWTPTRDRLLGTMPDTVLARKFHCSPMSVFYRRRKLGIAPFRGG